MCIEVFKTLKNFEIIKLFKLKSSFSFFISLGVELGKEVFLSFKSCTSWITTV